MDQLVRMGAASTAPLQGLLKDSEASVRRSVVLMIASSRTTADGKPVEPSIVIELLIPLLEESFKSDDEQVRRFACDGLGNFAAGSTGCLPRLAQSVNLLKELNNDPDPEVQAACTTAIVPRKIFCEFFPGRMPFSYVTY